MKRLLIALSAVLTGVIPFRNEREDPECRDRACANEHVATMPEQTHASEDPPNYEQKPQRMVSVGSPTTEVPWGSKYHLEHLRANGQKLEGAL